MNELDGLTGGPRAGGVTRREFLRRSGALGGSALAIAAALQAVETQAAEAPKKGGTLRLGLAGGSVADSLEIGRFDDSVATAMGRGLYNGLVEWGEDGRPRPDLALYWESRSGAKEWIFNLRKGVKFSNGKEFNADDAIYSLNYHRGASLSGGSFALAGVADIKKLDIHQIQVSLIAPDADFAAGLTDGHILMIPDGFTDWASPVGTGAFRLDQYDPGVRITLKRNPDYWKDGRGHLDAAEILVINDSIARFEALKAGQIDIVNRVAPRLAADREDLRAEAGARDERLSHRSRHAGRQAAVRQRRTQARHEIRRRSRRLPENSLRRLWRARLRSSNSADGSLFQ